MPQIKGTKKVKEAMLTIYNWAKENNIDYVSYGITPFGFKNSVTGTHIQPSTISLTYTLKDTEKWEKGYEGVLIKDGYFKNIKIYLEEVEQ